MSDFIPKPNTAKIRGLGPKAQKLQALRDKAAQALDGSRPSPTANASAAKANSGHKKTAFNRKAV